MDDFIQEESKTNNNLRLDLNADSLAANSSIKARASTMQMNLTPRSRRTHDYKKQRREDDSGKLYKATNSFTKWADGFDFFARPVISFNIQGQERVSTRVGVFFSFILTGVLVYVTLVSFAQIATYQRMIKSEKLEYGKAADEVVDFTEVAANLAFRASYLGGQSDATIDPSVASWRARIVRKKDMQYSFDESSWLDIPVKYCQ